MNNVIAVIDDGVEYSNTLNVNCRKFYEVTKENKIVQYTSGYNILAEYSHGTICAAIITKYCSDVNIISINVLSDIRTGHIDRLLTAIKWCNEQDIPLINLSIGSVVEKDFHILSELLSNINGKSIIVAAQNNNNYFTAPASLNEVIGVNNRAIYRNDQYTMRWYPFDGIEISASSNHTLLLKDDTTFKTPICNSYATPMIAAKVFEILKRNNFKQLSKNEILLELQQNAFNVKGKYIDNYMPYHTSYNYIKSINIDDTDYYWNRDIYNKTVSYYIEKSGAEISVPIINLNCYNHDLIEKLYNKFQFEGYEPCIILNENIYNLGHMYYIFASTVNDIDFCSYLNKHSDYDVFITQSKQLVGDVKIEIEKDNISTTIDNKHTYRTNDIYSCIDFVYDNLI